VALGRSPGRQERPSGLRPNGLTGTNSGLVVQRPETTSAWNDNVDVVVGHTSRTELERHSASVLPENVLVTAVAQRGYNNRRLCQTLTITHVVPVPGPDIVSSVNVRSRRQKYCQTARRLNSSESISEVTLTGRSLVRLSQIWRATQRCIPAHAR